MSKQKVERPYLIESRLGDLIGLIQVLGSTNFHPILPRDWFNYFGEAKSNPGGKWEPVFEQHPEFFRIGLEDGSIALKWRYAYPRNYDSRKEIHYTKADADKQTQLGSDLHHGPLSAEQISTLLKLAVELHARELALDQAKKAWLPIAASFAGGLIGAILGFVGAILTAYIKSGATPR